jgi:hypothetical protein
MKTNVKTIFGGLLPVLLAASATSAFAHCDTLDGPVVRAARAALDETNVNLVLSWVQNDDEVEIKRAFGKTIAVRKLNSEARELADMYFFETVVRIHRAGEGAPYTGLKPAGQDLGPAIPAADKALEDGKLEPVAKLLTSATHERLHKRFEEARALKNCKKDDVQAGRAYVKAYVEYVHYVEGVYRAASGAAGEHAEEAAHAKTHEHN